MCLELSKLTSADQNRVGRSWAPDQQRLDMDCAGCLAVEGGQAAEVQVLSLRPLSAVQVGICRLPSTSA